MAMMLVKSSQRHKEARLGVSQFIARDNRHRLPAPHSLSQLRPDTTHDSTYEGYDGSLFIRISLNHTGIRLARDLSWRPFANGLDLQAGAL